MPDLPALPDQPDLAHGQSADATAGPLTAEPAPLLAEPAPLAAEPAPLAAEPAPVVDSAPDAAAVMPETEAATVPAGGQAPNLPLLSPAACADLLRQHFPALFSGPAKPLKLRIQQDIQQRAPGVFSKATLSAFFRRHTGSTPYLIALSKASQRFDLDGQPAGELSAEHRDLAQAELTRRRALTREREQQAQAQQRALQRQAQQAEHAKRQADHQANHQAEHAQVIAEQRAQHLAQQAAQREAQRVLMAQQATDMVGRQERAAMLRDFQRTTLTLANFCVLKRTTPDALNPILEQARKEAAEAPPLPQRQWDERRGPPAHRGNQRGNPRDNPGENQRANQPSGQRTGPPGEQRPRPARDDRRPPRPPGAQPVNNGPRGPRGGGSSQS